MTTKNQNRMNHLALAGIVGLTLSACGQGPGHHASSSLDEAWDQANAPSQMDFVYLTDTRDYRANWSELPTSGALSTTPWSDNYYPTYKGGITYRWNQKSGSELKRYAYDIKYQTTGTRRLSPAEKYDIYIGDQTMPLTTYERDRTEIMKTVPGSESYDSKFKIPTWEGLCHAWAPATLLYKEPKAVELTSRDGVKISFGSSDVKALLTYALHLDDQDSETQFLGMRCEEDFSQLNKDVRAGRITRAEANRRKRASACSDTNAGAFHIVLANQLGRLDEGFVMDVTRDAEVWNQPVFSFESNVLRDQLPPSAKAAPGTVREIEVETKVGYVVEVSESFQPNNRGSKTYKTYRYRLELDQNDEIIGGEWLKNGGKDDRPDFLWKRPAPSFSGFFDDLKTIYEASIAE